MYLPLSQILRYNTFRLQAAKAASNIPQSGDADGVDTSALIMRCYMQIYIYQKGVEYYVHMCELYRAVMPQRGQGQPPEELSDP